MNLIDTHCHYNSYAFRNVHKEIYKLNNNQNVSKVINIGIDYNTSKEAIMLGNEYSKLYTALGIHPLCGGDVNDLEYLYNNYDNSKIVAIGEVGIDTECYDISMICNLINSIYLANKLKLSQIWLCISFLSTRLRCNSRYINIRRLYWYWTYDFKEECQKIIRNSKEY